MRRSAVLPKESSPAKVLTAAAGYDLAAPTYDAWSWSRFWDQVETPLVADWLRARPAGRVVDLGCGSGRYRALIEALGHAYTGVDVSRKMLDQNAKKHAGRGAKRGRLICADMCACPLTTNFADSVLCTRVLSHIAEPADAFTEIDRILCPGGECFLSDIDPAHAYEYTHMPTPSGEVVIETYKHKWKDVVRAISRAKGLRLIRRSVYSRDALSFGVASMFGPKPRAPKDRPLLYVCVLTKQG